MIIAQSQLPFKSDYFENKTKKVADEKRFHQMVLLSN